MVQTDQAVPAPWGCYCFPLMSPGKDQKQLADRREPALYMRTLHRWSILGLAVEPQARARTEMDQDSGRRVQLGRD